MRSVFITTLFLSLATIFTTSATAQIWLDDESIYNEAEEYIQGEEYVEALPLYMLLEKKGVSNSNLNYQIGRCLLNIEGKKSKSIPYLESAVENTTLEYKSDFNQLMAPTEAHILLGVAYRINSRFEDAISEFEKYKKKVNTSEADVLSDYHISLCKTAQSLINSPNAIKLEEVYVGETGSLFNPVFNENGTVHYMEKRPFYDAIIRAEYKENSVHTPENVSPQIKTDGEHELINSNFDGSVIILRAYVPEFGYELFYAQLNEQGKWSKYEKFPEPVNSPQNDVFAAFSKDMKTLYFCSNRTGGHGGTDIYVTHLSDDEEWTIPENLGPIVNSTFNETTIFTSSDGTTLYFSSEGHMNMGGTDYFAVTKNDKGVWGVPVNLGSPLSTPDNDNFLSPTINKKVFYTYRFDSEKDDKNKIYRVILDDAALAKKVLLKGQLEFNEDVPSKAVPYSIINGSEVVKNSATDKNGTYAVILSPGEYKIKYQYSDRISAEQGVTINKELTLDELNIEAPDWVTTKQEEQVAQKEQIIVEIKPVLFAFDSYVIAQEYYSLLDDIYLLLINNELIKVNLVGYTDAIGNTKYNQILSEKRAGEIKKYFVNKGLDKSRITASGQGENNPVAVDSKQGRKYNRRVDISLATSDSTIIITFVDEVPDDLKLSK